MIVFPKWCALVLSTLIYKKKWQSLWSQNIQHYTIFYIFCWCSLRFLLIHSIGLYTNYLSFAPFSYKIGLVKTLLHWAFVISSNWSIFHLELSKTKEMLQKNLYPSNFIDQQIKQYLHAQCTDKKHKESCSSTDVSYYKLPYIGNLLTEIKQKIIKHCKYYCKSTNAKLSFCCLKLEIYLVLKNQCLSI